ncbi:MAG: serine hydrolase [Pseudomonadota bacterium]
MAVPQNDPDLCGLSWATKVIGSSVTYTDRTPEDVFRRSCNWMAAPDDVMADALENKNPAALLALDPQIEFLDKGHLVKVTLNGRTAYARRYGDQGFSVVTSPDAKPHFTPVPVQRPTISKDWPMGDPEHIEMTATGLDGEKLEEAAQLIFQNPMEFTNALVVLHKGQVVLEKYRDPFDRQTQFESWSMGKSLSATFTGVAIHNGQLHLDEDHLFDDWTDDRAHIRTRDLLNMASGLQFTGSYGRGEDHSIKQQEGLFLDHIYVYASGCNSHEFCLDKPLADPPGTSGRYRNCDPLLAMSLVRERMCGGDIQAFLTWPYEHLFHKIGATGMILETDPFGHFLISGHDYGRAIDWARLGQLHLNKGVWDGQQLFSEDFAEFVRTPAAKAWAHDPYYGGFFPTNNTHIIPTLPQDAFWMSGGGLQRVVIIPSLDMVIVRLGHIAGQAFGLGPTLDKGFGLIAEAVKGR